MYSWCSLWILCDLRDLTFIVTSKGHQGHNESQRPQRKTEKFSKRIPRKTQSTQREDAKSHQYFRISKFRVNTSQPGLDSTPLTETNREELETWSRDHKD